ncbi:hypothetical protein EV401DRAFT_2014756 [Pisolithus croceorrhizus]|nr:hypothetical protein EV401DRAFT_2014756 [Pisolithus croceorrhizus]
MLAPIALLVSSLFATAHASVYVTNPVASTVCTGGQSCEVQWVDNGESPLLSSLGTCSVALYTGEFVLAQALNSIDVSASSSFSFTPNPSAGPNGQYYIVFSNQALNYYGYSASFTTTNTLTTTVTSASPVVTTSGSSTITVTPTTTFTTASTTTSTPSATSSSAALRAGSSGSLAVAFFLACAGALVF